VVVDVMMAMHFTLMFYLNARGFKFSFYFPILYLLLSHETLKPEPDHVFGFE
jgi:hypothetical protein